jgi:hypothetical protein
LHVGQKHIVKQILGPGGALQARAEERQQTRRVRPVNLFESWTVLRHHTAKPHLRATLIIEAAEQLIYPYKTPEAREFSEIRLLALAGGRGLHLPVVYNCGGYVSVEVLKLLKGLIEIYMPDFKYGRAEAGLSYSGVKDYPAVAEAALAEMYR